MKLIATFLTGLLFGTGVLISGMGNPAKVLNFFDFAGDWDPSLAFVMAGAVAVTAVGYRVVMRRPSPIFETRFDIPSSRKIDARLVGGAATFGVGWGIAGFCPGAVLPVLATGRAEALIFFVALVVGMIAARGLMRLTAGEGNLFSLR